MALINKKNNNYIRIDLDKSYISEKGIVCHVVIYKNKAERSKDKNTYKYMTEKLENLSEDVLHLPGVVDLRGRFRYYGPRIFWLNSRYYLESLLKDEDEVKDLETIDFDFSLVENPIVVIEEMDKLCATFEKQDLTLENLYPLLKKNFNCEEHELVYNEDTSSEFKDD